MKIGSDSLTESSRLPNRKNSTAKRQSQKVTAVDSQRRSLILNGINVKPKRSMSTRKAVNVNTEAFNVDTKGRSDDTKGPRLRGPAQMTQRDLPDDTKGLGR